MDYTGKWVFHSTMSRDEDFNIVYLNAEEYLNSPMPYIDENDEDEVKSEMQERKRMINSFVKITDDMKMYLMMALPEGVSQQEVDAAVAAGHIKLMDGAIFSEVLDCELRDGELWYNSGIEGEIFGEKADPWVKAIDKDGLLTFAATRYVKE